MINLIEEPFVEVTIKRDEADIGRATVAVCEHRLCNFEIYAPYRNKGYGQEAFKAIVEKYQITNLCVKFDNEIAKHVYRKNGFVFAENQKYLEMRNGAKMD